MRVKEESAKAGLKLHIRKTKTVASDPITSRQIEGGKSGSSNNFRFLDSKIIVDGDCSHERKTHWCESWTIEKAEGREIDAFKLWCWRRLLRALWTARRSNQSILKEISPEYSLEGLMLKLQYVGHVMRRADSLEKSLMLGKIEGRRRRRVRGRDASYPTTNPGTPAPGATRNAKTQAAKDARQSISSTVWTERGQDSLSK